MIVGCAALVGSAVNEVDKELKEESAGDVSDPSETKATFKNGVLTTPDLKIQITRYKVIKAGQKGNEYGEKPVIAFWYKTTNLSGDDVDPIGLHLPLQRLPGQQPQRRERARCGLAARRPVPRQPDARHIKKGGTVENAIAYELDDLVTPVDLVATEGLDEVIGKATYKLR